MSSLDRSQFPQSIEIQTMSLQLVAIVGYVLLDPFNRGVGDIFTADPFSRGSSYFKVKGCWCSWKGSSNSLKGRESSKDKYATDGIWWPRLTDQDLSERMDHVEKLGDHHRQQSVGETMQIGALWGVDPEHSCTTKPFYHQTLRHLVRWGLSFYGLWHHSLKLLMMESWQS